MADKCQFAGFIEEGKVCQHPAFQNSEYCYWHDPDIPKSEEFVRSALENVIKATGGDLEGYVLKRGNLAGMDFSNVNLKDADLTATNVDGAIFKGADMRGVKMNNASAIGADFENANLMTANLSSGNFTNANFRNTNFRIVLVENAIMDGAQFDGSDRRHTTMFMGMPASAEATAQTAAPQEPASDPQLHTAQTVLNADYAASPTVLNADYNESDALFDESEIQETAEAPAQPQVQEAPQIQPAAAPQVEQPAIQPQVTVGGGGMSTGKIIAIAASITVGVLVLFVLMLSMMSDNDGGKTSGTGTKTTGTKTASKGGKLSERLDALEEQLEGVKLLKEDDLEQVMLIERVQNAVEYQKKLEKEVLAARGEAGQLKKELEVKKEEFEKLLADFKGKLDTTQTVKKELEEKLKTATSEYASVRKQMTAQETSLTNQIAGLEKKLAETEKLMSETEGAKGNFAGIIEQLRETNDQLVKGYEKKLTEYKAKVAKLSQWYEKDKDFTEDKFNHFLVNWERYTVVGSPFSDYVVGVKFTRLAPKKVRSNIFILGVEGSSQPAFKILVFDADGKKIDGDLKTMMSQSINKGNIFTAKKELDIDIKQLRYFSVEFVQ